MTLSAYGQQLFECIENWTAEIEALKIRLRFVEQRRNDVIVVYNTWVKEHNAWLAEHWKREAEWKQFKKDERERRKNMTPEEKQKEAQLNEEAAARWRQERKAKKQLIMDQKLKQADKSISPRPS